MAVILKFQFSLMKSDMEIVSSTKCCMVMVAVSHTLNVNTFCSFSYSKEKINEKMRKIFKIQIMASIKIIAWSLVWNFVWFQVINIEHEFTNIWLVCTPAPNMCAIDQGPFQSECSCTLQKHSRCRPCQSTGTSRISSLSTQNYTKNRKEIVRHFFSIKFI